MKRIPVAIVIVFVITMVMTQSAEAMCWRCVANRFYDMSGQQQTRSECWSADSLCITYYDKDSDTGRVCGSKLYTSCYPDAVGEYCIYGSECVDGVEPCSGAKNGQPCMVNSSSSFSSGRINELYSSIATTMLTSWQNQIDLNKEIIKCKD